MKIVDNLSTIKNESLLNTKNTGEEADKKSVQKTDCVGDSVQLSSRAKDFQRIKDLAKEAPASRDEKIAAIKNQLQNGTYTAENGKVAENMVKNSLIDLLT